MLLMLPLITTKSLFLSTYSISLTVLTLCSLYAPLAETHICGRTRLEQVCKSLGSRGEGFIAGKEAGAKREVLLWPANHGQVVMRVGD